jgi:hypothetical protein
MDETADDLNFAFSLTMHEVLELVIAHCDQAQNTENRLTMGVHLKMASRAMRCALEVYGSAIETPKQGLEK